MLACVESGSHISFHNHHHQPLKSKLSIFENQVYHNFKIRAAGFVARRNPSFAEKGNALVSLYGFQDLVL